MTYPIDVTIDNWQPIGDGVPPATGEIVVPQSPSGAIMTDTGLTESATETYLQTELQPESAQWGTPTLTSAPQIAGVAAGDLQWYAWNSGSVGSVGSKFS